jgi:hypothetical protein
VPSPIETRPFTIHPDLLAWPSFRISSERRLWLYAALIAGLSFLIAAAMHTSIPLAIFSAFLITSLAFAFSFLKYKTYLRRPDNRAIYSGCVAKLTDDEVRQDYSDGSFMAIKLFAVRNFREIGDFYFAFATPKHGIVVPKNAFGSPEESREFANRLRAAAERK